MLGTEIEEADDDEVEVETNGEVETVQIPEYPFPFFRGKKGGVYCRPAEGEEADPALVYEHDLYVIKRLTDPDIGETLLFRLHLPRDGMREFAIPLGVISSKDKLREALANKGVGLFTKQVDLMCVYVMTSVKNLQIMKKAGPTTTANLSSANVRLPRTVCFTAPLPTSPSQLQRTSTSMVALRSGRKCLICTQSRDWNPMRLLHLQPLAPRF
jgi:hypothetical protein